MEMSRWQYKPATDLDKGLTKRLQSFPREPHLWMYMLRALVAFMIRTWLRLYHRFEIRGRARLPIGTSFILVANHQSHLDAPCLLSSIPLRSLHRAFPAAAADYFFSSLSRSSFSAIVVNALPFDREAKGAESLAVCRQLLKNRGNILVIFPEGTRSRTGQVGRFRSGVGRLVEGTDIPVVPCHISGAHRAFPKGASFPRPVKLVLTIGEPRSYAELPPGRETVEQICSELQQAVAQLGGEG